MDHVLLTCDPLEINKINDLVADDGCGAVSFFVGTTRDNFESKKVLSLEYEAYEPMALKEMHGICRELRSRWPDIVNIAIYHRMGLVKVREASVVIAISSPHRQTALDATAQAIEDLKRRVPIWKREKYVNDESAWKENKECPAAKKSKKNLDFSACPVGNVKNVMTDLVQIAATETEVEHRIESFVMKKREEIDLSNKMDFVKAGGMDKQNEDCDTTCARTDAVLIKQEPSSKGHLRVRHAARNEVGPQTRRPDYSETIDKHMTGSKQRAHDFNSPKHAIFDERIQNIETFLRLPTSAAQNKTIYQRLKAAEDRILLLEATSPEYKHFWHNPSSLELIKQSKKEVKPFAKQQNRKAYSIAQLDAIISEYEKGT